ncbi:MAG: cyclic nucleotide-binding domain-containing protein [Verrucomicrobiae bacterium]|nr:cyclic nucleotide-binding domain-containing protein [Verrucomicrobiae bacterium]
MKRILFPALGCLLMTSLFFSGFAQTAEVPKHAVFKKFAKNAVVFAEGDKGDGYYVIKSGEVLVFKVVNKQEKVLTVLGPGEIFGEMALVDDSPRSAGVRCRTEVEVWFVSREVFRRELELLPPWARQMMETLTIRLRQTSRQAVADKTSPLPTPKKH